jgi:hypothetical protein
MSNYSRAFGGGPVNRNAFVSASVLSVLVKDSRRASMRRSFTRARLRLHSAPTPSSLPQPVIRSVPTHRSHHTRGALSSAHAGCDWRCSGVHRLRPSWAPQTAHSRTWLARPPALRSRCDLRLSISAHQLEHIHRRQCDDWHHVRLWAEWLILL